MVFYDDGVGADSSGLRKMWEGGIGKGIDNLIYEAYRFISVNYNHKNGEDHDQLANPRRSERDSAGERNASRINQVMRDSGIEIDHHGSFGRRR